jgi:hypothetical protein
VKIAIENTNRIVEVEAIAGDKVKARVWEGETDSGIKVQCLITLIAVRNGEDTSQFERELKQQRAPQIEPQAFDLRLIL